MIKSKIIFPFNRGWKKSSFWSFCRFQPQLALRSKHELCYKFYDTVWVSLRLFWDIFDVLGVFALPESPQFVSQHQSTYMWTVNREHIKIVNKTGFTPVSRLL